MNTSTIDIQNLLRENAERNRPEDPFDPLRGQREPGRTHVVGPTGESFYVPDAMVADPAFAHVCEADAIAFDRLRCRHDFAFWCARCVVIKDKLSGRMVPFVLNRAQRRVLAMLEEDRLAGRPMRLIMLKARQWGGSTLILYYMAWMQLLRCSNWNSLILAHRKETSRVIREMYLQLLRLYPEEMWDSDADGPCRLKNFGGSADTLHLPGRNCLVAMGSALSRNCGRGFDFAMVHMSEVAFWGNGSRRSKNTAREVMADVESGMAIGPNTMVVLESTANGVGNVFHQEWERAEKGLSDKRPVFVPWHEIPIYRQELPDDPQQVQRIWQELTPYERSLWHEHGLTLEQVYWYHLKARIYSEPWRMFAEYPTTAVEAFVNTGTALFAPADIEKLRPATLATRPQLGDVAGRAITGPDAIRDVRFTPGTTGASPLRIWNMPQPPTSGPKITDRYLVAVDVGGTRPGHDRSVIVVIDRAAVNADGAGEEVVAEWTGNIDHDILAWKAAAIATMYNKALLVFESNSLETDNVDSDPAHYILNTISASYRNLYRRPRATDGSDSGRSSRIGFHTNRNTKGQLIGHLMARVRDTAWTERAPEALDELRTFELRDNGTYGAREGCHDDRVMARAIALWVSRERPTRPATTSFYRTPIPIKPSLN